MPLLNFLELLPLPQMFAACLACGALVLFIVTLGVWIALRVLRVPPTRILFDSGILITVLSLMFAVLIGFASAGIWNDEVQARAAVQREANAIENIVALASSYPTELREQIHVEMMRYARNVLDRDWPAMQQRTDANDNLYDRSNSPLVALVTRISTEAAGGTQRLPLSEALIGQILEVRSARLQRETIARSGISAPQWLALTLIATAALTVIILSQNQEFRVRVRMAGIYAFAVCSAFFVIVAHDRPFVGEIGIKPIPIEQAMNRIQGGIGNPSPASAQAANTAR
jgi:Protein of unknown function (DUF4239)